MTEQKLKESTVHFELRICNNAILTAPTEGELLVEVLRHTNRCLKLSIMDGNEPRDLGDLLDSLYAYVFKVTTTYETRTTEELVSGGPSA
jgi:hypothetical protein